MGICINSGKYYASKEIETDNINSGKGYCDSYSDGTFIVSGESNKYKQAIENLLAAGKISWEYDYTGDEKELIIPVDGTYKLEVWGAQGDHIGNTAFGGYSQGLIDFNKNDVLHIVVGQRGQNAGIGGYNGGGLGSTNNSDEYGYSTGGGGATHIASMAGTLTTIGSSNIDKIYIVAGGGGGHNGWGKSDGGSAGGYIGVNGKGINYANGGTQTVGGASVIYQDDTYGSGSFGLGGGIPENNRHSAGGGGGGLYGGACSGNAGGGGGSSYIGNSLLKNKSMYCYECTESTEESIFTVNTIGTSELRDTTNCSNGYDYDAVSKCAKAGNGYARITLVKLPSDFKKYKELYEYIVENDMLTWDFDYTGNEQVFNIPADGTYKIEAWGAQGASDNNTYIGGYGAYASGNIKLNKNQKLYLQVAEYGKTLQRATEITEKYSYPNGGLIKSEALTPEYPTMKFCSGGGSSNISLKTGQIKDLQIEDLIVIAAGGGGVNTWWSVYDNGGSGGGIVGVGTTTNYSDTNSTGGTQTAGGHGGGNLSYGDDVNIINGSYGLGGGYNNYLVSSSGGGGLYGGGASWGGSSAGGSSYIGNSSLKQKSMYCYGCMESNDENTLTINTKGTSDLRDTVNCPNGYSNNPISKCAKAGNGYIRITYILN